MMDTTPAADLSPVPAPQQPKRSIWFWFLIAGGSLTALVLVFAALIWMVVGSSYGDDGFGSIGNNKIAVVDVDGVILSADKIDSQLRKFADDDSVKAIILHINSPGGGAAASQEIYHEVLRLREQKKKPIVASVESVGASGAYYIASACNKIYANDASVVGSIGVIMEWVNYGDLLHWAKLKEITLKAGALKDAGSPTRDLTPKEQAYFQSLVDNMHGQFIHDVATARHMPEDKIQPLATGQVWTGQQALPLGLIDQIGGFRVALMDTARSVGISGEPTIVRPSRPKVGLLDILTGNPDSDSLFPNPSKLLERNAGFYFLWK
ncbi:MAG: signal peptide peptidase SppA [Acidobacteriaceae bacterium]